jgi:hypothetical protein
LRWLRDPVRLLLAVPRARPVEEVELRRRFDVVDRLRLALVLRRREVRALPLRFAEDLRAPLRFAEAEDEDEDRRERERVEVDRLRGARLELDRLLDDVRLRLRVDELLVAIPSHSP